MVRYEYGGDEFVFVQLSEEMSLEVNFRAMAITQKVREKEWPGILDVCPANASYMIRVDPDVFPPDRLIEELKELEKTVSDLHDIEIHSRVVDVPILFEDPWTHEALMRFRDRHQDPNSTDLEYAARINGYSSKEDFIQAITSHPFLVSMVGFVPGLPFCFQMVPRERQIEAPKYVRPRTYTLVVTNCSGWQLHRFTTRISSSPISNRPSFFRAKAIFSVSAPLRWRSLKTSAMPWRTKHSNI